MAHLRPRPVQSGAVLITGLILLVVFTLVAVGSMRLANRGEKLAANGVHRQTAFEVAESAVAAVANDETAFEYLATQAEFGCQDVSLTADFAGDEGLTALAYAVGADAAVCQLGVVDLDNSSEEFRQGSYEVSGQGRILRGDNAVAAEAAVAQGYAMRIVVEGSVVYERGP